MLLNERHELSPQQLKDYLERIGYHGEQKASAEVLCAVHQAHLSHIPFENLDIRSGRPLTLEPDALLDKLLRQKRGGFCYEQNFALCMLLRQFGFQVSLLSARVMQHGQFGPEFDHMLLCVEVDGLRYLADVGFGDSFRQPFVLGSAGVTELGIAYQARQNEDGSYDLLQTREGHAPQPQYRFSVQAHALADFLPMFRYQQESPASHFTQKSICSLPTANGRISLSNDKLIRTAEGLRKVHTVASEQEYRDTLRELFGIRLDEKTDLARLMSHRH